MQGTEPPTAPRAPQHRRLPTAPGVCLRCVCVFTAVCVCVCVFTAVCVCVHFGWVKCRAQILSMGHHTWPHVTSLSLNSFISGCANHFTPDCFLNEGQLKASFVKKLKLKDRSVPIVRDPAAPPEEVSLPLYIFFMIICKSPLLFHRREAELISI